MQLLWYLLIIRSSLSYSLHYLWTSSLLFADVSSLMYPKAKCRHERLKRLMVQSLSVHTALLLMFSLNFAAAHTAYTRHDFSISSMSLLTNKYIRSLPRHTVNGFVNIFRTSQVRCQTKFPLGFSLHSFPLNMVEWTWRYRWWASMTSLLNFMSTSSSTDFSKVGVVSMETDSWR